MTKKIFGLLISAACAVLAVSSCYEQDDIYKEYVKVGGYVYPAKPINESYTKGYKRVLLHWTRPMDPAVKSAKVFWENYTYSMDVDYSKFPDGNVTVSIGDLEERSYTFDIIDYDSNGNQSLPTEVSASPYGDFWLSTMSERVLLSARMQEDGDALLIFTPSTDRMTATRVEYVDANGATAAPADYLLPDRDSVVLSKPKPGKKLKFSSAFCPLAGADTVWAPWKQTPGGLGYALDTKDWAVTVTTNQIQGTYTPDKIFDGVTNLTSSRWLSNQNSTYRKIFPKILTIDTKREAGKEYCFTDFDIYMHPSTKSSRYVKNVYVYVTDEPLDPDVADYQAVLGEPYCISTFTQNDQVQTISMIDAPRTGRYFSLVFTSSYNSNGYIDVWELVPYGSVAADM